MKNYVIIGRFLLLTLLVLGIILISCKKDESEECPEVDYTTIDQAISEAQQKHDDAVEGTGPGEYPPPAKNDFQQAIDLAKSVRAKNCVTQDELNTAENVLKNAITVFESQKVPDCPEVNYTEIDQSIANAQQIHDNAVEGSEPGEYLPGSKAELQQSIDNAQSVRDNFCVSQQELNNAVFALNIALDVFESKKIIDLSGNLVSHWLFNGNSADASGNGHDGTPTAGHPFWGGGAAPQLTVDRFGNADYCYHFDQGCNVEVPYASSLNPEEITISLWIKMEEQDNNDYIISMNRWNGYKLNLQSENFAFFTVKAIFESNEVYYDRDSNPGVINPDVWTHVVVTFKDGFMNFYMDGVLVKAWDNTPGTPITVDNIPLSIGSDLPTGTYSTDDTSPFFVEWGGYFKGNIDDIRFYNTELTNAQVTTLYNYEKDNVIE